VQLRNLQGDKYDADKAVRRLIESLQWRRDLGLVEFLASPDEALIKKSRVLRPRHIVGFDKRQRPLMFERLGHFFSSSAAGRWRLPAAPTLALN